MYSEIGAIHLEERTSLICSSAIVEINNSSDHTSDPVNIAVNSYIGVRMSCVINRTILIGVAHVADSRSALCVCKWVFVYVLCVLVLKGELFVHVFVLTSVRS